MAIYTTLFLAHPDEMAAGFPGWKPPLPAAIRRQFRHPFTGEFVVVETREPEWPSEERRGTPRRYRAEVVRARYEGHLEGRLPSFVRERPHLAAKGLTDIEMEPLLRAVGVAGEAECPLYAPPSSGASLRALPPGFVPALRECDRVAIARQ